MVNFSIARVYKDKWNLIKSGNLRLLNVIYLLIDKMQLILQPSRPNLQIKNYELVQLYFVKKRASVLVR